MYHFGARNSETGDGAGARREPASFWHDTTTENYSKIGDLPYTGEHRVLKRIPHPPTTRLLRNVTGCGLPKRPSRMRAGSQTLYLDQTCSPDVQLRWAFNKPKSSKLRAVL